MKLALERARLKLVVTVYLAVVGCAALTGCSVGSQEVDDIAGAESTGSVSAELQIDPGATLTSVAYSITGPSAFSKTGTLDVHASTALTALIGPIPAGTGFTITFSATATDGTTTCGGAATFDIAAGQTTSTTVSLRCHEAPHSGSVQLNGSLNVCPVVDGIAASPADVLVGHTTQLTGTAHDLDHGPSALAYAWATDLGTLSEASAQSPTFTCSTGGTAHVTLSVSDGDPTASCADSRTFTIVCTP
ncbi:MAG TPA: hypothetical protein VF395_12030 [Polyangiaceae bacterium]